MGGEKIASPGRHHAGATVVDISRQLNEGASFPLLLGNFLDEFRRSALDKQMAMIALPPEDTEQHYGPFLAASVHKLANDNGLEPPAWVFDNRFFLPANNPYFSFGLLGNERLMAESPPEFKLRNLFVTGNVLERV